MSISAMPKQMTLMGDHENEVVGAERYEEARDAFEGETDTGQSPGPLRELLGKLDGQDDAEDVREECREPDHSLLPLGRIHRVVHPLRDGRLQEGQGHVGHHQGSGAASDVGVDEQPPDGGSCRPHVAFFDLLGLHRPHDQQQENAVEQADKGQDDERPGLSGKLVQDSSERRGHQAAERDEGQGYAEGLGPLGLLRVPVGDHGKAAGVGKGRSDPLQAPGEEEQPVRPSDSEEQGGEEHDGQAEHHGQVVAEPVDDRSGERPDEDLDGGLRSKEEPDAGIFAFVLDQDAADVDLPRLVDVRHGVVAGRVAARQRKIVAFLQHLKRTATV